MQNRKGESPMENTNVLFDRKRLVRLIVPLIVEQVLAVTVGMADMVMVSGAGETAHPVLLQGKISVSVPH